jgi:hypothetical protein
MSGQGTPVQSTTSEALTQRILRIGQQLHLLRTVKLH